MNEPWLLYFLIFGTVFLLIQFAYAYLTRDLKTRRHINRRLADLEAGKQPQEAILLANAKSRFAALSSLQRLERLLNQAGVRASRGYLLLLLLASVLGSAVVFTMLLGSVGLSALAGALVGPLIFLIVLRIRRKRRIARFAEQLPDVLEIIVRSLRAGHPLMVALGLASREMPDPAGSEFGLVSDEVTFGRGVQEAVSSLYERVGYEDLVFFATAVSIQQQTGGNLAEILDRLAVLLRGRFKLRRKAKALSAEGRFSALALSIFPFLLIGVVSAINPSYYGAEWGNPIMTVAFAICGVFLVIGNIVMYKMVNFKV